MQNRERIEFSSTLSVFLWILSRIDLSQLFVQTFVVALKTFFRAFRESALTCLCTEKFLTFPKLFEHELSRDDDVSINFSLDKGGKEQLIPFYQIIIYRRFREQ